MINLQFVKAFFAYNTKLYRIISLTILLLITSTNFSFANYAYTQSTQLSLNLKGKTLKEVFNTIESKSEYVFFYKEEAIDESVKVSINAENKSVDAILEQILKNTNATYLIDDRQVYILASKEEKTQEQQQPQQNKNTKVTGLVTDSNGSPLIGVSVVEQGSTNGTITDIDGNYSINVSKPNATLVFTYIGFNSQNVALNGKNSINVVMDEDIQSLDEVIVVGYGTQNKLSVSASISQISGDQLVKAPVGNVTNMLAGRVPGVISLQQSGQPGADQGSVLVRGQGTVYIVDGIRRDFSEIDPNEIETVSVLKDASSTAVYGLDATSVVIVTTKRGKVEKSTINFVADYGISENAVMLEMLDGPQYAHWYNKARQLDGDSPVFSDEHVRKMLAGIDGWGNTNWYKKTFGTGHNRHLNVNASGGTEKIRYFVSVANYNQEGNVDNFTYDRMSLRSNVDAQIAQHLELAFNVAGRIEKREVPGYGAGAADWNSVPQQAIRALPFVSSEYDGLPVSTRTASSWVNPLAASNMTGYGKTKNNVIQTNMHLKYNAPFLKGLSGKFLIAYDYTDQISKRYAVPYQTLVANVPGSVDGELSFSKANDARGNNTVLNEGLSHVNTLTTNTSIEYENKFGSHFVKGLVLAETRQTDTNSFSAKGANFPINALDELNFENSQELMEVGGTSSVSRFAGFIGRFNYAYKDKYLAEVSARYDGSYQMAGKNISGKRWVWTPAISLAWRASEESFIKDNFDFVDNLKLRAGYGETPLSSGLPPYFYLDRLNLLNQIFVVGKDGKPVSGLNTSNPANINLTWAKARQYNIGLDFSLWNGLLGMELDVFYKYMYDMPTTISGAYPDSFGGYFYGYDNLNKQDFKGFEVMLTHRNKIDEFSYEVILTGTYAKRRWLYYANDSDNMPDWLKLTGKEVDGVIGFIADGLFQSEEEIRNSALIPGKDVRVGDIKYVDRNGDGKITYEQDRGYVGKSAYPRFTGGLNFSGQWKGFDMSFLLQGSLGSDVALTGTYSSGVMDNTYLTKPFYHGGNSPRFLVEGSWTPENTNGEFPRLHVVSASSNNAYSSTFWYRNGDYLRLKSLQIGYTIPRNILKAAGIERLRLYAEGQNLFTLSELTKYGIDPEHPGVSNGHYPQQRIYSFGLNLTF